MPLYDYHCPSCGDFRAWRPMREAGDPTDCPECRARVGRTMVAPNLALMPSHNRIAHQRNERSAHEPRVASNGEVRAGKTGPSADHHHHHHHQRVRGPEPGLVQSHRPWSVGH
jgi:putative FmdB family regulatory protein